MIWVNVKEELPKLNTKVIVVVKNKDVFKFQAFATLINLSNELLWQVENVSFTLSKFITHWKYTDAYPDDEL